MGSGASSVSSLIAQAKNMLRGNNNDVKVQGGGGGWAGGTGGWHCRRCDDDDDDDDVMGGDYYLPGPMLAHALQSSREHQLWEDLLCEKVSENEVWSITGCSINLKNCHMAEHNFEVSEPVVDIKVVPDTKLE